MFSITGDLRALDELLDETAGELTPEVEAWLEEYKTKLTEKVDGVGEWWWTIEARAAGYKKAAEVYTAKRRTEERKLERLKEYVKLCLAYLGARKVAGKLHKLSIERNGGVAPLRLLQVDPALFPESCRKVVVTIDNAAVRAALENGTLPDGLAALDPVGESVRLR
jgi:hypothetical protein